MYLCLHDKNVVATLQAMPGISIVSVFHYSKCLAALFGTSLGAII